MSTTLQQVAAPVPSGRGLAILRAVAAGRVRIAGGGETRLLVDGIACSDQFTAHLLLRDGLIEPAPPEGAGSTAPAQLTAAGRAVLAAAHPAA
ncbi:hypothetical protein SAMN05421810_102143 [Amycolatopsis arida]|uniref:Uncharacterized protein n=1 Tax=Amycolatopsis arida TaxID=587909 RepID=A0A1I5P481_9PSEU|nr:hypothetical protein [Amycolatopsis arida]TDX98351.1 hypothetical protein CLV69_101143 [Amycolatopsis arida]SFP28869.1 hypothetical protein SAMN05421810_102143 [Amycolatopsis arida]